MDWLKGRFVYAFAGLKNGILKDKSLRAHLCLMVPVLILGVLLRCSVSEWLWLLLSITLVLAAETFNSCIEKTVDYISLDRNPQAALIKDMAAAGVMVVCLFAAVCGLLVFLPKLMEVFS